MRARPTRPWKGQCGSICLWIFHDFRFLKVSEKYPLWREIFFGPWRWTFWTFFAVYQALTEKQKVAWESWLSFCFSVKAWNIAGKIQKVHLHGPGDPQKISRQRGYFSETFRKRKSWKIQRQIDPHWPFHGLVGLALTKSKKLLELFWKF